MNSYNDNLHSSVITTLQTLELAEKNLKSNLDSSIFSLYYAEGAIITASENLNLANVKYKQQQNISSQAVKNANIAANLTASAMQQKSYTAQSVTNAAVSASNIQIASNAVVRLAGDVGNIFSILKAADAEGELYLQGEMAYSLINATAYDAEKLSQTAMEASTYTAEVSSDTVADEATATNSAVTNLLAATDADFNAIAAIVTTDHAALASAGAIEKIAEGTLESSNAEYFSVRSAYRLNNRELNLNLTITNKTNISYDVYFNYYNAPFGLGKKHASTKSETTVDSYPVQNYYLMLVKDSKKQVFTISNAENMLLNHRQRKLVTLPQSPNKRLIQTTVSIDDLVDSDGQSMQLGVKYAIFVFAQLREDYKKLINNFDDYLSAPSESFALTVDLVSPETKSIEQKEGKVKFTVIEPAPNVQHRVIYLPDNKGLISGLLSEQGLRSIEKEVLKLERIADKYDPIIADLEAEILTLQANIDATSDRIDAGNEPPADAATDNETTAEKPDNTSSSSSGSDDQKALSASKKEYAHLKKELASMRKKRDTELQSIKPAKQDHPGFYFNVKIAEQVSFANYTVAKPSAKPDDAKNGHVHADLSTAITDNFGDPLIPGYRYIPVILSVADVPEEDMVQYKSSLSDYAKTTPFKYEPTSLPSKNEKV
ncbi:hypothetical protein EWM62_06860 [Mucilaginibacter terrigena]|uniref:Uncharacterized protein n=1 Tax=Mucilaginibacter terrigena TaxID=2492395 RepID=A0A4Q5LQN3_9SPHI|nr:hypothetical protein [Mucilaginibacter terrigena]RYU91653.1 hypothetical protein EWM62_06860 [Mucilaginibacter terrigena]